MSRAEDILNQIRSKRASLEKTSFVPPPPPGQPQDPNAQAQGQPPPQGAPQDPSAGGQGAADPSGGMAPGAGGPGMDPNQQSQLPPQTEAGPPNPNDPAAGPGQYAIINIDDLRNLFMEISSQQGGGKSSKPKKPSVDDRLANIEATLQQLSGGGQSGNSPDSQQSSQAPGGTPAATDSSKQAEAEEYDPWPELLTEVKQSGFPPVMSNDCTGSGVANTAEESRAIEGDAVPSGLSRLRARRGRVNSNG